MASGLLLGTHLSIAIAIVLVAIVVLKWNPMVGLVVGSLYMGLAAGLGLVATLGEITQGFGDLMASIGLSIGFGVIIGQLLYDCGGARSIAHAMVRRFPGPLVLYGIGLTAFVFGIPVFYDVTFVILIPIALALTAELRKPLPYAVCAVAIGAATAHVLVPPTPGPLAAAGILGFDLGVLILAGLFMGGVAAVVAMKLMFWLLDRGLWSKEKDESGAVVRAVATTPVRTASLPLAIIPLLAPIILILLGTVWAAIDPEVPPLVQFLSNKVTAMLVGAVAAYLVAATTMTAGEREASASTALASAGVVILITGAGGGFGAVIKATGVGELAARAVAGSPHSALVAVLVTYGMAAVFRVAQGSGTVAAITTMTIMAGAGLAATVGLHPLWIALAALSGGISVGHVNDSGFWVTTNLSGLTVTGGLKVYTLSLFVVSAIVLAFALLGSAVMPAF
jgi:gluconate:H+ symporter, GntP family